MDKQEQLTTETVAVYYKLPYATELDCEVTRVEEKGVQHLVELDQTIFYPEGGGQPSDQGELIGPNGSIKVENVRIIPGGRIVHQGKLSGRLELGDKVHAVLKWPVRHWNMRVHSAGHLIHEVLMTMAEGLVPTKGNHGQKAFLEYAGHVDPGIKAALETKINETLAQDLPIITRDASYEEIVEKCRFVPSGLPKNKQLRFLQIGDFSPMPDGGVQVKSTREIGRIIIHSITATNNTVVIRYGINR